MSVIQHIHSVAKVLQLFKPQDPRTLLLGSSQFIEEVAYELGFAPSFKNKTGISTTDYRTSNH